MAKLEGIKAVLKAREEFKDRLEIKVVAFPQQGVIRDPGAEDYVRQANEMGADVVGRIPWIEYTDADAQEHIDRMFALAKQYDKDISMLVDDAGIGIALVQDDIADAYYPFGRNNMLEAAFLAAHLLWMTAFDHLEMF